MRPKLILHLLLALGLLSQAALGGSQEPAAPQEPQTNWVSGPSKVELGKEIAELNILDGYVFADGDDSRKLLERMGNTTDGSEVGMVLPKAENQDWMMIFEWAAEGYVKDDDKDKIDKDKILKNYKDGTEAGNEQRRKRGIPALHVVGWFEEPHYDPATHNLVWALLAKNDAGGQTVNYNVRLLGREGYMSVTLVDEPSKLTVSKPYVDEVLKGFTYRSGKSYAEFRPGDKVAKYGLAALVGGGTAAAAVKLGLFGALAKMIGKAGKALVLVAVAFLALLKRIFGAITGRRREE